MGKFFKTQQEFQQEKQAHLPLASAKLPSFWRLLGQTWDLLSEHYKLFLGLGGLYLLAFVLFAQGLGNVDLVNLQKTLPDASQSSHLATLTLAALGFDTSGASANQSATNDVLTTIVFALCTVWATRQVVAGRKIRIRDALYNGPTAIIPVVLLLLVILFQAMPMALGIFIYGAAMANGLLHNWLENGALLLILAGGVFWTCYLYGVSILSVVAATLPGMYPRQALKATKELVGARRWQVVLYLAIFALVTTLVWLVLVVGMVSNSSTLAITELVVGLLRAFTLVFGVVFIYKLYRSLVDETA